LLILVLLLLWPGANDLALFPFPGKWYKSTVSKLEPAVWTSAVGINLLPNGFTAFSAVPSAALSAASLEGWRGEVNDKLLFSMPGSFLLCCKVSQGWHVFYVCLSDQHFCMRLTLARPLTSLPLFNLICRKGALRNTAGKVGGRRKISSLWHYLP